MKKKFGGGENLASPSSPLPHPQNRREDAAFKPPFKGPPGGSLKFVGILKFKSFKLMKLSDWQKLHAGRARK